MLLDAGWDKPRCVTACPTDALSFVEASELTAENLYAPLERMNPEFGTKPRVAYVKIPKPFVAFIWAFAWEGQIGLWFVVIVAGIFSSVLATVAVAAVPEICGDDVRLQNYGLATFAFANGVGSAIGGVALGWIVPSLGWATGSRVLFLPILALAFILIVIAKWDNRVAIKAAQEKDLD